MTSTVKEFITKMGLSELYNLSWVDNLTGEVNEKRIPTLISFINEGLENLSNKFSLKKDSIYLFPYPHKFTYKITSEHMMDENLIPDFDHYLWKGLDETFTDNLLRIVEIQNSDGDILPLNDPTNKFSVFTTYFNEIKLLDFKEGWEYLITYIASPDKVTSIKDILDIPPVLIPALTAYVAYKAYDMINTAESIQISSKYFQLYTNQINEIITSDSINDFIPYNPNKFCKRGWV